MTAYAAGGPSGVFLHTGYPANLEQFATDEFPSLTAAYGFGYAGGTPAIHCNKARGTIASPEAPSTGDRIFDVAGRAYLPATGDFCGSSFAMLAVLKTTAVSPYTPCTITIEGTGAHSPNREVWLTLDNANMTLGGWGAIGSSRLTVIAAGPYSAQVWSAGDYSTGMAFLGRGNQLPVGGENGADAMMFIRRDSVTGRSINASGTINASGADYAEYEILAPGCGAIEKGQIIGFDAAGRVTDKWADSVSFGVKSTNPSYVGGDNWFSEPRPQPPVEPSLPTFPDRGAPADEIVAHQTSVAEYESKVSAFPALMDAYNIEIVGYENRHANARAGVDRIAYCGKVPVNVTGAKPGQWIVAVRDGAGISGKSVRFRLWRKPIGHVRCILNDGRAEIVI
jgi:hypothetical protein